MFRVIAEGEATEAVFTHPLGAVSRALTCSMAEAGSFRVIANGVIVCIARRGMLLDPAGEQEISPISAVRTATELATKAP